MEYIGDSNMEYTDDMENVQFRRSIGSQTPFRSMIADYENE